MAKVELEELVIKLAMENQNLITGLKDSQKATTDAMGKISGALDKMAEDSKKSGGIFQNAMSTALGFMGGSVILGGINAAKDALGNLFNSIVTDGIAGAIAGEDALNRLNQSMASSGHYSKAASSAMNDFASEMQRTTKFGDDAVLSAAGLISSLGRLDQEGLQGATTAAADLAAALGIDLQTAATMVGKAANGEVGTFGRYGIAIKEGNTHAETLANTLAVVNSRFGGAAAAQVNTFSGGITLLGNQWGELTESMMSSVTQNVAVNTVMGELGKMLFNTTAGVDGQKQAWREMVAQGMIYVIDVGVGLVKTFDYIMRTANVVFGAVEGSLSGFGMAATKIWSLFSEDGQAAFESMKAMGQDAVDRMTNSFSETTMLEGITTKMENLSLAAQEGFDKVAAGALAATEPINGVSTALQEVNDKQKKMGEDGKALAEGLLEQSAVDSEARAEMRAAEHALELEQLTAAKEQKLLTEDQFSAASAELSTKYQNEEQARKDKIAKAELARDQQKLQATSQFFGGMSALAMAGGKDSFAIGKRLAQAQAITDGVAAVQNALATVPYPFNIAAAAGMGAMTAANVVKIEGQQFNAGGTVPGMGFKDTVPAMLTPGEEVVNKSTSNKLREYLNGEGGGQGGGVFHHTFNFNNMDGFIEHIETKMEERKRTGQSLLFAS